MRPTAMMLALFFASGCAEPLEFADWTIPVPEGTRIIEYAPVRIEGRTERVDLVEDLVIGRADDPNEVFYQATNVAVGSDGAIYVADSGNFRVQKFSSEGEFLRTFGAEGQGPGEFRSVDALVVIGERLLVADRRNRRLSVWMVDGRHIEDHPLAARLMSFLAPTPSGDAFAMLTAIGEYRSQSWVAVSLSQVGEEIHRFIDLPLDRTPSIEYEGRQVFGGGVPRDRPSMAASLQGSVYATPGGAYQVFAFDETGQQRWAMRVAWEREPFAMPDDQVEAIVERLRPSFPNLKASDFNWPKYKPIIRSLLVDGHGHLFVTHYVYDVYESELTAERPVDVYDSDGNVLFHGFMGASYWWVAQRDFVYALEFDGDTGDQRVVRYRLVEPF